MKLFLAIGKKVFYIGFEFQVISVEMDPKKILIEHMRKELDTHIKVNYPNQISKQIDLIKILRRQEISHFMEENNLICHRDLNDDGVIGLGAAKDWVEKNCPFDMLN